MRFASIRWGIFLLNLGTLGHWILELFAMYATDGQTDRQTDGRTKATLIVNVNINHKFIQRITAKASNALNTLVSGKEESLQS